MIKHLLLAAPLLVTQPLFAQQGGGAHSGAGKPDTTVHFPSETHFSNVRQLTFGGDNAEAYFGFDNEHIVFQRTAPKEGVACDQIFYGSLPQKAGDKFSYRLASTGRGRTTCSYLMPDRKSLLYASTHAADAACPPVPDRASVGAYVWPIYESFEIYVADLNGKVLRQLTKTPGYDAEATISPKGDKIVFTSMRNGDLDLYTMNIDGSDVRQITDELGYDGGAWFSPDGSKIVWRASRPQTDSQRKYYLDMLNKGMVVPTQMEVFIANADGSDAHQITSLGNANWAPNFTPDGRHIIFASNHAYKRGFPFNIYLMDLDGKNLEKVSHDGGFDAFPAFSPDGKKIIFSSNRNNGGTHDTNLFIADWKL